LEREELESPCPRKEVDGRFIYVSRKLGTPKNLAPPVLCDFGATVSGEKENVEDAQPNLYRAPEVILGALWGYEIDIWNAGCLVGMMC
jgi:serine/threonine-protein kinase SRPK3